jgi:hypothetical protein
LLFNFALECAIRRIQVNKDGLKLNGTHQHLVDADDDVNILGGSVHALKKTTEALVAVSMETRLEVNTDKTKCMVTSRDQNKGRSHSIKSDNSFFETVEDFKYLETTLTHPNSI